MTELFIGMPVYNGERFISNAIESLRSQTFTDWKMLISDNGSEDGTRAICEKYAGLDSRIDYYRQEKNIGAPANFKFLLDRADTPFFMWAAADDVWHREFISACIGLLKADAGPGLGFCNIVNIDSFGRKIRDYGNFARFAGSDRGSNVAAFVSEPEILGKANVIYSIYRTDVCKRAWARCPLTNDWGSDMCFVLAALAGSALTIDSRVLFSKRIAGDGDQPDHAREIVIDDPERYVFPFKYSVRYVSNHLLATKGTGYRTMTLRIMSGRVLRLALNRLKYYPHAIGKRLSRLFR